MAKKKSAKKPAAKAKAPKAKAAGKKSVAKKAAPKKSPKKSASPKKASKPAAKATAKPAAKKAAAKATAPRQMSAKATSKTAGSIGTSGKAASVPAKFRAGSSLENLFTPLDDRLIIEIEQAANRTAGGLYIPDSVDASDGPKKGKVVAVGRGHRDKKGRIRPLDVQLGDVVMYEAYLGAPMKIGDRELVVLRESQLLGVVK